MTLAVKLWNIFRKKAQNNQINAGFEILKHLKKIFLFLTMFHLSPVVKCLRQWPRQWSVNDPAPLIRGSSLWSISHS